MYHCNHGKKPVMFKFGLSPSKKVGFVCFNESPIKMMNNALCSLFLLKIFESLS